MRIIIAPAKKMVWIRTALPWTACLSFWSRQSS